MKINYANGKKNNLTTVIKTKSLGMLFENRLNLSNEFYLINSIANIHKKPTPIQVVNVEYPKRSRAKITEAYYRTASTTDYNGVYKGKYIDFEAKETINTSFSFSNISKHQLDHLKNIDQLGGIAFIIIYFRKVDEVYIIDIKKFLTLIESDFKSVTSKNIIEYGQRAEIGYCPPINYLKAVDILYSI